jgi:hypothetical protein
MSRPATTILLLTRQVILRADFSRTNSLVGVWTQPRPDGQEWPILVEVALGLGPKPGKMVFVLSSDLWTQTLSLPHGSASMSPTELASALNFEAEALSGHSAFESVVGFHGLSTGKGFWIVQARTTDLTQADEIVRKSGSRFGGLGHPGGVPRSLNPAKEATVWLRIEFWPDAVFFLHDDGQSAPDVQVLNADAQMGRWRADWEAWRHDRSDAKSQEALAGPGVPLPTVTAADSFALDDNDKMTAWLAAWAERLAGTAAGIPLVRPTRQPLSTEARRGIAVGLAALVLVGCGAFHLFLDQTLQNANAEIKQAQEPESQRKSMDSRLQGLRAKQKDVQARIENLEKALKVLGTQRQRLTTLLTTLGTHHPEHLYVEKMEAENGEPQLRGRCLEPELADQFASKLSQCLLAQGWEVQAPRKHAETIVANGSPWSFEISFKSASEMTLDTRLEPPKSKGK